MPFVIYSERNEQESAKQFAYRILRRNILLLDMVPGEPISEKEIAKKLELSRTPVREALLELCRERLVEIYPQRGTRVALMDSRLVDQGRFLRETVELALLELACRSVSKDLIEQMEENLKEQEEAAQREDIIEFFLKDNDFHRLLFTACGKESILHPLRMKTGRCLVAKALALGARNRRFESSRPESFLRAPIAQLDRATAF